MLKIIRSGSNGESSPNNISLFETDALNIEKKNLINIFKLVVKDLIDVSLKSSNRHVDKQSKHLIYFYDIFDNILNHGFKSKKGFGLSFLTRNKEFTVLLDVICNKCDVNSCLASIKDMSEIKSSLGRIRAWARLSIMQKKLSENFMRLASEKDLLNELYEKDSILVSEEAAMISGILVGINALDISIDLKSDAFNLDLPIKSVNYSIYLREKLPDLDDSDENDSLISDQKINEIFDQKNYLEEINKKLELQVEQFQHKIQTFEKTNMLLLEKMTSLKNENAALRIELEDFKHHKESLENDHKQKIETVINDIKVERETFNSSKTSLDHMYIELQKKFIEENKLRVSLEAEIQTHAIIKSEQDSALKLLENSLKDKHEIVNILRDQLEQVKCINLDLVNETQKNETDHKNRAKEVEQLSERLRIIEGENENILQKLEKTEVLLKQKEAICKSRLDQLEIFQNRINELEKDLVIEKNWRIQLQKDVNDRNEIMEQANNKMKELTEVERKYFMLQDENEHCRTKVQELEITLEEMGSKLGVSHLKMEDFKQVTKEIHEFQWEQDDQVTTCKTCTKDFNVARRKHHCRRCGKIFCNECSDNKMALPSSHKPVRVCNNCFEQLIQKSTLVNK